MKKFAGAVLLLLIGTSLALGQKPSDWIEFRSTEGRFSVSLPKQPALKTQESTTADGDKFPQYLATATDTNGIVFMIGYFDVAAGSVFSTDVARDAMVKQLAGKIISESAISLGGYPGRDLNLALKISTGADEGATSSQIDYVDRVRIYEADNRIYIVQVFFPKTLESDAAAKVTQYFDSFQVQK